jgi:hypothetical protein
MFLNPFIPTLSKVTTMNTDIYTREKIERLAEDFLRGITVETQGSRRSVGGYDVDYLDMIGNIIEMKGYSDLEPAFDTLMTEVYHAKEAMYECREDFKTFINECAQLRLFHILTVC